MRDKGVSPYLATRDFHLVATTDGDSILKSAPYNESRRWPISRGVLTWFATFPPALGRRNGCQGYIMHSRLLQEPPRERMSSCAG